MLLHSTVVMLPLIETGPMIVREVPAAACFSSGLTSGRLVSLVVSSGLTYRCWFMPGVCLLRGLDWDCRFLCGVCLPRGLGYSCWVIFGICYKTQLLPKKLKLTFKEPLVNRSSSPMSLTFLFHCLWWVVGKRRGRTLIKIGCKNIMPTKNFL